MKERGLGCCFLLQNKCWIWNKRGYSKFGLINMHWFWLNKPMRHVHILNTNKFKHHSSCFPTSCCCWEYVHVSHVYSIKINVYLSIQTCCNLFCFIFNTCFVVKNSNPDLVLLLSHRVKYLFIWHISQLWHVTTFEQGCSGISNLHQSCCYLLSSFVFIDSAKLIRWLKEPPNSFGSAVSNIYRQWLINGHRR